MVVFFTKDQVAYFFNNSQYHKLKYVGMAIGVFAFFVLLKKIFAKYVFKIILRFVDKTRFNTDTKIVEAFQKPVTNFFEVLGFYFAFRILAMADIPISIIFIDKMFSSVVIMLICWGLCNLSGESSLLFERMHKAYDIKVDKILFPFISKTLTLVIIALTITIIAEKWGYNIQGFVTGLGLGGLAFALAAKDAAANVIAGIFIILDKPFSIGDWVNCDGLEGTIEDISFRTTKIRTVDNALITVPNSKLANEPVTNFSRRGKRRVNFYLEINYKTSKEKLQICVNEIRHMIENHPEVSKDDIAVRFDKLNADSLDVLVCFFTETAKYDEYLKIKEEVNFNIAEILQQERVLMAFPSRSVYLERVSTKNKEEELDLINVNEKVEKTHNDKEKHEDSKETLV
jgi:MscS family membrane protein